MMDFYRILMLPFSLVYSLIILVRNFLYNKGLLKSYQISIPVVSIGNISTGGTGKSPFTIFLTELFKQQNLRPAIISRGYKRKSDDMEIVYDGSKIASTVDKCGDEPMMMALNLSVNYKDFYILTCKDRVRTSEYVVDKFNPDLIILDDAYQHRKIKRNIDIVLTDAEDMDKNKFINRFTIPAGNLRENFSNLSGADIIIQNNKFSKIEKLKKLKIINKDVFILNYRVKGFYDNNNMEVDIKGKEVCAFAGIAKPSSFFEKLEETGCNIIEEISFRDHKDYNKEDISRITRNSNKETLFITTEKDFVKIKEFGDFIKYFNVLFMKIELILDDKDKFFSLVQKYIAKN
jgi:tetraacyldisaccharide 4'-kinase